MTVANSNNGGDHGVVVVVVGGARPARTKVPATRRHHQLKTPSRVVPVQRVRINPGQLRTAISRGTAAIASHHKTARARPVRHSKQQSIPQRIPGQRHLQHNRQQMRTGPLLRHPQHNRQKMGTRPRLQEILRPSRKRSPRNKLALTVDAAGEFLPAARLMPVQSNPVRAQTRSCPHSKGPVRHASPDQLQTP